MLPLLRMIPGGSCNETKEERREEKKKERVGGGGVKAESKEKETDVVCLNASGAEMGHVRGVVLVPKSTLSNFI